MEKLLVDWPAGIPAREDAPALRSFVPEGRAGWSSSMAVAQPRDTAQIQSVVRWARSHGRKLVPISSAEGPRRHGVAVPEQPSVFVDLSSMKRVRHVDGQEAVAVLEPGVTFPELDAQLAPHGLRAFKPLLPRRSKSVVASYLEREPIISPREQWDSCDPMVTVEMVFGNGDLFRTGSASVSDPLEAQLEHGLRQMNAPGPYITDFMRVIMNAQGSLGIVSWASVYCERIPALEKAFFVPAQDLATLADLHSQLAWRKLAAHSFIVNNMQLALMFGPDREGVLRLARSLPPWILFVNIAAPMYFPQERIEFETDALREDAAALGLQPVEHLHGLVAADLLAMQAQLPTAHYKTRLGALPDEIFFLTQTDKAPSFVPAFDALHRRSGAQLPYAVYVQPRVQGSSCHMEFTTFWEATSSREAPGRSTFHAAASHAMDDAGAYFSRPYGVWKDIAYGRDPQIVPYLRHVKATFDPDGVLNPGKFC